MADANTRPAVLGIRLRTADDQVRAKPQHFQRAPHAANQVVQRALTDQQKGKSIAECRALAQPCVVKIDLNAVVFGKIHQTAGLAEKIRQPGRCGIAGIRRSEEPTSELQSLMRLSYAVI